MKPDESSANQIEYQESGAPQEEVLQENQASGGSVSQTHGEQIQALLNEIESGNSAKWWELNIALILEPDSRFYYQKELESDLTASSGWKLADATTRERIIAAAKKYIANNDPDTQSWLGTNTFHRPANAGLRAFRLLLQEDAESIDTIPEDIWRKWAPIILAFPIPHSSEGKQAHQFLIQRAYQHAPEKIIQTLMVLIDKDNKDNEAHDFPFIRYSTEGVWGDLLAQALLDKIKDKSLKPNTLEYLLGGLLDHEVDEAKTYAESHLTSLSSTTQNDKARSVSMARALVSQAKDAGWLAIWPAFQEDAEFGQEVMLTVSQRHDENAALLAQRLNETQLADLYIWLVQQFPHSEDPQYEGAHSVGPRESVAWFRDSLLNHLKVRGTPEACEAIRWIAKALPELEWMKWVLLEAEANTRRKTWKPLEPSEILKLTSESLARHEKLAAKPRLYIEEIDSFQRVRTMSSAAVSHLLKPGGVS